MNPASSAIAALENFMTSGRKLEPLTEFSDDVRFVDSVSFKDNVTIDDQTFTPTELKNALNAGTASLPLSGGTMTGVLTLASGGIGADSLTFDAATVKSRLQTAALPLTGGTLTGVLTLASGGIITDTQTYTANQLKVALNAATAALPQVGGTITNTTAPQLALYNSTGTGLTRMNIKNASSVSTNGFYVGINDARTACIVNEENTAMIFHTNANERMRITNTGDVGIGTISPANKLHVVGTGQFTGALTLGGGVTADSTTFTAAEVKNSLNLTKSGGTMGGLLTLNSAGLSADTTTFTATQVKNALTAATLYTATVIAGVSGDTYFTMSAMGNPPYGVYAFTVRINGETTGTNQENQSAAGIFYRSTSFMPGLICAYNGLNCRASSSQIWITNPFAAVTSFTIEARKIL